MIQIIKVVTVVGLRIITSAPAGSPTEDLKFMNFTFYFLLIKYHIRYAKQQSYLFNIGSF